ncbi:hypothetical protein PAMA_014657 [Pampus argenteus]
MDRQKIEHLQDRIKYLEEANVDLKNDKDFLLAQIKGAHSMPASTGKDSRLSSSSEEEKEDQESPRDTLILMSVQEVRTDAIIHRYKNALRIFNNSESMKKTKINVDRNTIARTAVIAELAITFPDTFKDLVPGEEKMSAFAERCRGAITEEMAGTITAKKKKKKENTSPKMYTYT